MVNPSILNAVNPALINTAAQASRRSVNAHQARNAAGREINIDEVANIGGEWNYDGLPMRALERGWGGWSDTDTPPWEPKHELSLIGNGGIYVRNCHRETIATNSYHSLVGGNRTVEIGGDCETIAQTSASFQTVGTDNLQVHGNAEWSTRDRVTIGTGTVNRHWEGDIMRMIGMEGVIAGGAFLKTFVGSSMTMAPLASGDIYGGAGQAAGIRYMLAVVLGYRSTEMCGWMGSTYRRACWTVIEPIVGTPAADGPRNKKMKALRIFMGLCPLLDILVGAAMAPVAIGLAIRAKAKGIKDPGPQGKPRVHMRNGAAVTQSRASDMIM